LLADGEVLRTSNDEADLLARARDTGRLVGLAEALGYG
jgi:hypothetical protein